MVFTATVGDRYIAVGRAKDGEGEVAVVVRDLTTDPKGENQTRVVMSVEQLMALRTIADSFIENAVEAEPVD